MPIRMVMIEASGVTVTPTEQAHDTNAQEDTQHLVHHCCYSSSSHRPLRQPNVSALSSCLCKCYATSRVGTDGCVTSTRHARISVCSRAWQQTSGLAHTLRCGTRRPCGGARRRSLTTLVLASTLGGTGVRDSVSLAMRESHRQEACSFSTTPRHAPRSRMSRAGACMRDSAQRVASSVCCRALATAGAQWVSHTVCARM